jgi:hypothetical protein
VTNPTGLTALNEEVTRQASIIAYANDFKFLFLVYPATGGPRAVHATGRAERRR